MPCGLEFTKKMRIFAPSKEISFTLKSGDTTIKLSHRYGNNRHPHRHRHRHRYPRSG